LINAVSFTIPSKWVPTPILERDYHIFILNYSILYSMLVDLLIISWNLYFVLLTILLYFCYNSLNFLLYYSWILFRLFFKLSYNILRFSCEFFTLFYRVLRSDFRILASYSLSSFMNFEESFNGTILWVLCFPTP